MQARRSLWSVRTERLHRVAQPDHHTCRPLRVIGLVVGFGAYHRQSVMPRIADEASDSDCATLRGSVRREIIVMIAVIVLGGILAYIPPPEGADAMSAPTASTS